MSKVVYVSHPLRGKEGTGEEIARNKERVSDLCRLLVVEFPDVLFLSPIHGFGFLSPFGDQTKALDMCLQLVLLCDELWAFGDYESSEGCMKEIAWAEEHCIPVAYCAVDDERCGGAYKLRNRGGAYEVEAVEE